jgi:hypothetical protein
VLAAAGALLAGLAGCASETQPGATTGQPGRPLFWRSLQGGFLAPTLPGPGQAPRLASGMFMRWMKPGPLALLGNELLVADLAGARLWRADTAGNAVTGIAGAPVGPGMALALGPDLSAWVLDPVSRQVLRFARDGRLLQTHRIGTALPSPVALALADGGATLLLADGLGAQWSEQRGPGGLVQLIAPAQASGQRISGVDALAVAGAQFWVLDRLQGVVHRVSRQGKVLQTLGHGELLQPVALAVDRLGRVLVHDAQDGSVKRLRAGLPALRWTAADLGLQQIGGLAIDGMMLAVSDPLAGQVVLHSLAHDTTP